MMSNDPAALANWPFKIFRLRLREEQRQRWKRLEILLLVREVDAKARTAKFTHAHWGYI